VNVLADVVRTCMTAGYETSVRFDERLQAGVRNTSTRPVEP
jgi:hypothetical protein